MTAPVPDSIAPVMMTPEPSPLSFTYAPEGTPNEGHQPQAMPIASSSGRSWPQPIISWAFSSVSRMPIAS